MTMDETAEVFEQLTFCWHIWISVEWLS